MEKTKRCFEIIYFFLLLFFSSYFVSAVCSIGATPLGMGAEAKPGQEVLVTWNLYNLYGDRMTHVVLDKISGPDWEIRYDPPLHEEDYDVSGVVVSKTENLAIERSSVVLEIPEKIPEGISYVKHPKDEGYIPVRQINIYVKIPEDAELWQTYKFVFEAKGDCFTEPGTVIPAIATQLKVDITPKSDFYEKSVSEKRNLLPGITGAVVGSNATTKIFSLVSIFLLMFLLFLLVKLKKNTNEKKIE